MNSKPRPCDRILSYLFLFSLSPTLWVTSLQAQEEQAIPEARPRVMRVRVEQARDREVIIEEAEAIYRRSGAEQLRQNQRNQARETFLQNLEERAGHQEAQKPSVSYVVNATVFQNGVSKLTWHSTSNRNPSFSAYSNFDWHKMYGFQQIEGAAANYTFLLMASHATPEQEEENRAEVEAFTGLITGNPQVRLRGYRLSLDNQGALEQQPLARQFMGAVHRFIADNRRRIHLTIEARREAKRERERQEIADRGKPKPAARIRFSRVYREDSGR